MAEASGQQMTIFYGGKVNVYDGMPPDKVKPACALRLIPCWLHNAFLNMDVQARAIMHLAASSVQLSHDDLPGNVACLSPSSPRQIHGDKLDLFLHGYVVSPTAQTGELFGWRSPPLSP